MNALSEVGSLKANSPNIVNCVLYIDELNIDFKIGGHYRQHHCCCVRGLPGGGGLLAEVW